MPSIYQDDLADTRYDYGYTIAQLREVKRVSDDAAYIAWWQGEADRLAAEIVALGGTVPEIVNVQYMTARTPGGGYILVPRYFDYEERTP